MHTWSNLKGIEINGQGQQLQNPSKQGSCDIKESTIKDAEIAIYIGTRNINGSLLPQSGGGIVNVDRSFFENNHTNIFFTKYDSHISTSTIKNSTFDQRVLNSMFMNSTKHIYVNSMNGLLMSNNKFLGGKKSIELENSVNTNISRNYFEFQEHGIVGSGVNGLNMSENTMYDVHLGIEIKDSESIFCEWNRIEKFENGIRLANVNEVLLINNVFSDGIYGVILEETAGVKILENKFDGVKIPIKKQDSKTDPRVEEMVGNRFVDAEKAIVLVDGDNSKLDILCNQFSNYTEYGIEAISTQMKDQGTLLECAGNDFIPNSSLLNNCLNHTGNNFTYYYGASRANSFTSPDVMTSNIAKIEASSEPNCIATTARLAQESRAVFKREVEKAAINHIEQDSQELELLETIAVYPNPNNGTFTIELSNQCSDGGCMIKMYNILGEEIQMKKLGSEGNKSTLSINDNAVGVYMIVSKPSVDFRLRI